MRPFAPNSIPSSDQRFIPAAPRDRMGTATAFRGAIGSYIAGDHEYRGRVMPFP